MKNGWSVYISLLFPGIQSLGHHFCTDKLRITTLKKTGLMNEITVIFCFLTLLSFVLLGILPEGKLQEMDFFLFFFLGGGRGVGIR